jgi:hypothetical protein
MAEDRFSDGMLIGLLIGIFIGVPLGWIITQAIFRAPSTVIEIPKSPNYSNIEEWGVTRDENGKVSGVVIHREARRL